MANFATVDDIREFLQLDITDADQITAVTRALEEITEVIKTYCRQAIEYQANDEASLDSNGSHRLVLPEHPVVSVASVVEDETTLDVDDDYRLAGDGLLYRMPVLTRWKTGPGIVVVTYTHGYETIPNDLIGITTRAAARAFQAGLKSSADGGVIGITSKSLGDYAVSYGSEQGGGVGDGVMGASAARFLLRSEREVLDAKYSMRRWPVLM